MYVCSHFERLVRLVAPISATYFCDAPHGYRALGLAQLREQVLQVEHPPVPRRRPTRGAIDHSGGQLPRAVYRRQGPLRRVYRQLGGYLQGAEGALVATLRLPGNLALLLQPGSGLLHCVVCWRP